MAERKSGRLRNSEARDFSRVRIHYSTGGTKGNERERFHEVNK